MNYKSYGLTGNIHLLQQEAKLKSQLQTGNLYSFLCAFWNFIYIK